MERLQHCLNKPDGTVLNNPDTWLATPGEIANLCQALWSLEQTRVNWPMTESA
jgi:hypothetical protein